MGIYKRFEIELSQDFREYLVSESRKQSEYSSAGRLSFETVGYDRASVEKLFTDIYNRFEFVD